jgi:hypothetical protein
MRPGRRTLLHVRLSVGLGGTAAPRIENFDTGFALEDGSSCASLKELGSLEHGDRCMVELICDSADLQNGKESKELLSR